MQSINLLGTKKLLFGLEQYLNLGILHRILINIVIVTQGTK